MMNVVSHLVIKGVITEHPRGYIKFKYRSRKLKKYYQIPTQFFE